MANTLYDFYTGQGQTMPSVQDRAKIYESSGLGAAGTYAGTAGQNTALLNALSAGSNVNQNGGVPVNTTPNTTVNQSGVQGGGVPQATNVGNQGGMQLQDAGGDPTSVQDLINMGYGGYAGWNWTEALADFKATGGDGKFTAAGNVGNVTAPPPIDLTNIYDNLSNEQGINDLQAQLNAQTQSFNQALSKINDNPYLSEANRVGRAQKLTIDYNNSIKNLQDQIALRTANVETKLGLASKQYDMQTTSQQNAFAQFNSLLSSGALSGASAQTIASLARSTGISVDVITSAINAAKNKDVQLIQTEDANGKVVISVVDSQGNLIRQTDLGTVGTPSKTGTGTKTTKDTTSETTELKNTVIANLPNVENEEDYLNIVRAIVAIPGYDKLISIKDLWALYQDNWVEGMPRINTQTLAKIKKIYNDNL